MKTCSARWCQAPIPDGHVMCRAHWTQVPLAIKRAVWRTRSQPAEQAKVVQAAIAAVWRKEHYLYPDVDEDPHANRVLEGGDA